MWKGLVRSICKKPMVGLPASERPAKARGVEAAPPRARIRGMNATSHVQEWRRIFTDILLEYRVRGDRASGASRSVMARSRRSARYPAVGLFYRIQPELSTSLLPSEAEGSICLVVEAVKGFRAARHASIYC